MASAAEVPFQVVENPPTSIVVTALDGQKYEVRMALMVATVVDTGQKNPLDGMPILTITSQLVTHTRPKTNA